MKLKIAIVVHGRFHAFDLARALLERGHGVFLFTNYPKWAVAKFGIPKKQVYSFWIHGVLARLTWWARQNFGFPYPEAWLHEMFGAWASAEVNKEEWDVVHAWSGISEETRLHPKALKSRRLKILLRGSAHIHTQSRILGEEEKRTGVSLDRPSDWVIAREEREYDLADKVLVLSTFAYNSFIEEGFPPEKLMLLPLGVQTESFRPSRETIETRCERILSGAPLRILYVGALSFQKGMWDMADILRKVNKGRFQFRLVGQVTREFRKLFSELKHSAAFIPKQPQRELPKSYAWADLFIFPTLHDGFAQVLTQAQASGLPILTTTNCSGPDLIKEGETGWIMPTRNPESFMERLKWCDAHRKEVADMVERIYTNFQPRDWKEVAEDFESLCKGSLANNRRGYEEWKFSN